MLIPSDPSAALPLGTASGRSWTQRWRSTSSGRSPRSSPAQPGPRGRKIHQWPPQSNQQNDGKVRLQLPSGKHNDGKSALSIGKSTINGPFSIAKLVYQRVSLSNVSVLTILFPFWGSYDLSSWFIDLLVAES